MAQSLAPGAHHQVGNAAGLAVGYDPWSIMVKNFPQNMLESEVKSYFMAIPNDGVWACNHNRSFNRKTGHSEVISGQFFVNFVSQDLASSALQKWDGLPFHGQILSAEFKRLRSGQIPTKPSNHDYQLWQESLKWPHTDEIQVRTHASTFWTPRAPTNAVRMTAPDGTPLVFGATTSASQPSVHRQAQTSNASRRPASLPQPPTTGPFSDSANTPFRSRTEPVPRLVEQIFDWLAASSSSTRRSVATGNKSPSPPIAPQPQRRVRFLPASVMTLGSASLLLDSIPDDDMRRSRTPSRRRGNSDEKDSQPTPTGMWDPYRPSIRLSDGLESRFPREPSPREETDLAEVDSRPISTAVRESYPVRYDPFFAWRPVRWPTLPVYCSDSPTHV